MDETERKIVRQIEKYKEEIIRYAEDIEAHPEPAGIPGSPHSRENSRVSGKPGNGD